MKFELFPEIVGALSTTDVQPLKSTETLMLSANTSVSVGIVKKSTKNEVTLSLKIPIVPFEKEKVGIARNINGHWRLIGYGEII